MIRNMLAVKKSVGEMDRRVWWLFAAIGFFAVLVMKEAQLPAPVLLGFGGLGLLGLFMVGLQSPELPLYVLVAYLPFSKVLVGDFGTQASAFNLTNLLMVWIFVGHLLKRTSSREPIFEGVALNKVILLFCLMGVVALMRGAEVGVGSWYLWTAITNFKRWLTPLLMYYLALNVVREKSQIKAIVVIIMVAVTMVEAMATWEYMNVSGSTSFDHSRIGGIAGHSNTLGAFFAYYMFLLLGFFFEFVRNPRAWALVVPFLICFRGIMVTFSRGAYLAFAAGSLAATFVKSKTLFLVAIGLGAVLVSNPAMLPGGVKYRMGMTVTSGEVDILDEDLEQNLERSAAVRVEIWRGASQMIQDHPAWGVGYGLFPLYIGSYTEGRHGGMDAHNSYLLIAAEMGIPTLVAFLLILVMVAYTTRWVYTHTSDRFFRAAALGFQAGLVGLLVANMFGSRVDSQEVSSYFWILAGLMVRIMLIEKRGQERDTERARSGFGPEKRAGGTRPPRLASESEGRGDTKKQVVVKGAWD